MVTRAVTATTSERKRADPAVVDDVDHVVGVDALGDLLASRARAPRTTALALDASSTSPAGLSASRTPTGRADERLCCHAACTDSSAHDASTSQRACDSTVTYRAVHDEAPPWSAVRPYRIARRCRAAGEEELEDFALHACSRAFTAARGGQRSAGHAHQSDSVRQRSVVHRAGQMSCWTLTPDVTLLQSNFKFIGLFSLKLNGLVIKIAPAGPPLLVLVNPPRLTAEVRADLQRLEAESEAKIEVILNLGDWHHFTLPDALALFPAAALYVASERNVRKQPSIASRAKDPRPRLAEHTRESAPSCRSCRGSATRRTACPR